MKFNSKTEATGFLAEANISFEVKATLIDIVEEHALEGSVFEIVGDEDDVLCVIFEADHDVKLEKEIESHVICAHSVKGVCVATVVNNTVQQSEETIMENNQDIAARIAAEMEAFKVEQRAKFDQAVRAAAEQMLAAQAPAPAPEPAAEPSRLARLASKVNVQKVKKVAIYAAGVAAVGVGGYFAWKKFCGNDIVAAVAPVASEQL